ncbi:MAG: hypothetical protein ACOVNU_13670 [Candidatus Kapaibacteriota bacterium]|jgi:hypothetical protein
MAKSTSFSPIQVISLVASSELVEHRFIGFNGAPTADSDAVLGVTYLNTKVNDIAPVITLGTAIIESSEAIAVGDYISTTIDGKAKVTEEGDKANGRAITSTSGSGFLTILLTP